MTRYANKHDRRRIGAARDQPETPFALILALLVRRVPGARAAALVDSEGETVDYSGHGDPFSVRVAAAHWRLVLEDARGQASLGEPRSVTVRAPGASFVIQALPEGYAILLILLPAAGFVDCQRALTDCARLVCEEAGWRQPRRATWYSVDVLSDPHGRPAALRFGSGTDSLEVLGRYAGVMARCERAWRVRTHFCGGVEATLVREPGGFWYADEPLNGCAAFTAPSQKLLQTV